MAKNRWPEAAFAAWMASVTVACLLPADNVPDTGWEFPYRDKLAHFTFYFVGGILGLLALRSRYGGRLTMHRAIRVCLLVLPVFGLLVEGLQSLLNAGRSAEWWDAAANLLGVVVGLASFRWAFHASGSLNWPD